MKPISLQLFGLQKLRRLCDGLNLSHQTGSATKIFKMMSESWSDQILSDRPLWQNDITDDATPFEFSVAFNEAGPTLRLLFESQQFPVTSMSSWKAGLKFNEKIRDLKNVSLVRFDLIRDLFAPDGNRAPLFSLWHAANFAKDGTPSFKIYLNPNVRNKRPSQGLVQSALSRLDMNETWDFLKSRLKASSSMIFFSLDLAHSENARVKIYVIHNNAHAATIESQGEGCRDYVSGDATRWIQTLAKSSGPFSARPLITCYSFTSAREKPRMTTHVPIRCYASSDREVLLNAQKLLPQKQFDLLKAAVTRIAHRPLTAGRGLITYMSARREMSQENITFYFSPEAYAICSPRHWL